VKPAVHPRAKELLAERAIRPLDDNEHWELHQLGAEDDDSFDLAAAGLALALTPLEPLPPHLAQKIFDASPAGFEAMRTVPGASLPGGLLPGNLRTIPGMVANELAPRTLTPPGGMQQVEQPLAPQPEQRPAPTDIELGRQRKLASLQMREKKKSRTAMIVPWLAAAACLALAIGAVLWALNKSEPQIAKVEPPKTPLTPSQQRDELMAKAADITKLEWTATADENAKGAKGDVVWSAKEQKGYMRFVGLTPNEVTQYQYQLWIFDKNRPQDYPVDGGVFDVSSTGEVIVPISAKLNVGEVALFAVTIEKPGGVVVSKRERIVVTAART